MFCDNLKLEKSMYTVSNKSFTEVLEELDPSENYKNTSFENLDAYQRQLKRFNIKVSGPGCDTVEKFFCTSDSAVLFPEFLTRAVKQGIKSCDVLNSIAATVTKIEGGDYRSIHPSVEIYVNNYVPEGESIRKVTVKKNENLVDLKKYGRLLSSSYEALRFQNLDVIAVILKQIGMDIAKEQLYSAVAEIQGSTEAGTMAEIISAEYSPTQSETKLEYNHLLQLWESLNPYKLNTMIASSKTIHDILALEEMRDAAAGLDFQGTGNIVTPVGSKLIVCENVEDNQIVGLDKNFALQMIQSGDVLIEYDKIIDKQLEEASITMITGFSRLYTNSVKILDYNNSNS